MASSPVDQGRCVMARLFSKVYQQGDCKLFRLKGLSYVHHKQPMGKGVNNSHSPENPPWRYAPPGSSMETTLKAVCKYAERLP